MKSVPSPVSPTALKRSRLVASRGGTFGSIIPRKIVGNYKPINWAPPPYSESSSSSAPATDNLNVNKEVFSAIEGLMPIKSPDNKPAWSNTRLPFNSVPVGLKFKSKMSPSSEKRISKCDGATPALTASAGNSAAHNSGGCTSDPTRSSKSARLASMTRCARARLATSSSVRPLAATHVSVKGGGKADMEIFTIGTDSLFASSTTTAAAAGAA
mmetsp:Transcript_98883/g.317045  ORF Transcript_98883/g.317045 Transcript_98883/m.317045 type:complete len:213 (+) Transcript_98883:47-685(+)